MINYFQDYLTFDNIYLWVNFGIIPFWILLIFFPNSRITQLLINSIIIPLIIGAAYIYVIYKNFLLEEPFFNVFELYLSLESLYTILATEALLLVFWLHFVAVNLFLGSWVSRDGVKYGLSRSLVFVPLIIIYFSGPVGLVLYWIMRIFYSKKIGFHD